MTDLELAQLLRTDRERGMEALLGQYGPLLRYVIGGVLRDPQDAEDCYSEVTLSLWQSAERFDPEQGRLSSYLTAAAPMAVPATAVPAAAPPAAMIC